jgi:hypothetical protein
MTNEKQELSMKCNGLHSGTKFYERKEGQHTIEHHEHPETGELIIMDTWYVQSGEDDVDHEFEVLAAFPPTICDISKRLSEIETKIKNYDFKIK